MRFFRILRVEAAVVLTVLGVGGLIAWLATRVSADGERGYEVIAADDLEPFRSAFDANSDHVRLVLLVGPT